MLILPSQLEAKNVRQVNDINHKKKEKEGDLKV